MTPPRLEQVHQRLLLLLAVACFSEGFDFALLTVVLPQVRHTFQLSHLHADLWVAALYLGALPALVWGRRADRHGRRQVLLIAIVGYTLAAALTAASPNIEFYVACQFVARCFIATQIAVAWTMAAEDLPADRRGFGFGVLALSSAVGTGFCAIVEAVVLSPLNASWRWLYLCALPFLVVVVYLNRTLPESARFLRLERSDPGGQPLSMLVRPPYRRLLVLICLTVLLANLTTEATVFAVDFLETTRGLSDSAANLLLVASGGAALPVLILAGRVSDRLGRRLVCMAGLVVQAGGLLLFFVVARGTLALGLALMLTYLGLFAAWTTGNAFAVEAFPTSLRAGASSAASMAKLLGQASSFALAAALSTVTDRPSVRIGVLVIGPIIAAALVALLLPETSRHELTDLAVAEPVGSGEAAVAGPPGRRIR